MDDPWAAGPSWAGTSRSNANANADTTADTDADAGSTSPKTSKTALGMVMPRSPKQGFSADEADPWGQPSKSGAGGGSGSSASEGMRGDIHRPELGAGGVGAADLAQAKGWELEQEEESGWGETSSPKQEGREDVQREAEIAQSPESPITTSPKVRRKSSADHAGVWTLNSPKVETAPFPPQFPPESPLRSHDEPHEPESHTNQAAPPEIPLPTSPELASPPKTMTTMPTLPTFSSPKSATSPRLGFGHFPHDSFGSHASFADPGRDELGFGDSSMSISRTGTMPHSPSFGEDGFGGFSTALEGDPWGGGGWGAEPGPESEPEQGRGEGSRRRDSGFASIRAYTEGGDEGNVEVEEEEEGEGWGGVKSKMEVPPPTSGMDKDWEEAQWRIKVQEERAPRERIQRLQDGWREVAAAVIGLQKLEALTEAEESQLEAALRKLAGDTSETLRTLASIPSETNTYPPVLSNFTTHSTYQSAVSRPNPNPSSSLLHVAALHRARRRDTPESASGVNGGWMGRSRLGEPEHVTPSAPTQEETTRSKWSFWNRNKAAEKPLVTSGGGILEVKALTPTSATAVMPATAMAGTSGTTGTTAAIGTSGMAGVGPNTAIPGAHERHSTSTRSASITSIRPSQPSSPTLPTLHVDEAGHASPSGNVSPAPSASPGPGGPSAVSRFWGRFGRKSAQPNPSEVAGDAKDLELGEDDFSFLAEVPSLPVQQERGMADLLALEPRLEGTTSLENMLAASKPAALPQPLAPPPTAGPRAAALPAYGRSASQTSKFVAKMKVAPSDMDLLGGLDFDSPDTGAQGQSQPSPIGGMDQGPTGNPGSGPSMWDEFLSPSTSAAPSRTASLGIGRPPSSSTPPILPGPPMVRKPSSPSPGPITSTPPPPPSFSPPPILPGPPVQPLVKVPPVQTPATATAPAAAPSAGAPHDEFGDFDDFGSPRQGHAANGGFDDFGDFGNFAPSTSQSQQTHPTQPILSTQPIQLLAAPTPPFPILQNRTKNTSPNAFRASHLARSPPTSRSPETKRRSLDHTPTISLLTHSTSLKGRRWPAPPSPVAPALEPPPKAPAGGGAGAFPFLSPPPPGRSASATGFGKGAGDLLGGAGGGGEENGGGPANMGSLSTGMAGLNVLMPGSAPMVPNSSSGSGMGAGTTLSPSSHYTPSPIGLAPTPPRSSTPSSNPHPQAAATTNPKGGLSAQDLSFFDNL